MLNKKRINIAIDGPSGVGKSVISKMLAKKLNYKFLSSGNFYRIVAYNIIQKNIDPNISENIISSTDFSLIEILEDETILYNKKDITKEIREEEVSKIASIIAKYQPLREKINHFIQEYSKKNSGIIVDGRDATYRILPNAKAKFFMWASPEIRAKRRHNQNVQMGIKSDYNKILTSIKERDHADMSRKNDPLKVSEGSIEIDTTDMSVEENFEIIYNKVLAIIKES